MQEHIANPAANPALMPTTTLEWTEEDQEVSEQQTTPARQTQPSQEPPPLLRTHRIHPAPQSPPLEPTANLSWYERQIPEFMGFYEEMSTDIGREATIRWADDAIQARAYAEHALGAVASENSQRKMLENASALLQMAHYTISEIGQRVNAALGLMH